MPEYPRILSNNSVQLNEQDVIQGVHHQEKCTGYCYIHNKSKHPLRHNPLKINLDTGLLERICEHGIGHPDVDYLHAREESGEDITFMGVHSCDGCCQHTEIEDENEREEEKTPLES